MFLTMSSLWSNIIPDFFLIYFVKWLPSQWLLIMYLCSWLFHFKHQPCSCPDQIAFCDSFQGHFFSCQYNFHLSAPSQQRWAVPVVCQVPLLSSDSRSTCLQQTKQLSCTFIMPLLPPPPKRFCSFNLAASHPKSDMAAAPGCAHTPKHGLPSRAACLVD